MRRWPAAALAFVLAAAAAYAMQLGPSCKSSKDCGRAQECVAHEDRTQDVVRRTCEYPCRVNEPSASNNPACPKDRSCMVLGNGPRSSLGGICVRIR